MNWMTKFLMGQILLMDEADGNGAGGGSGGGEGDKNKPDAAALAKENAELKRQLEEAKKPKNNGGDGGGNSSDLTDQARQQREADAKRQSENSSMESAMRFNLSSKDFLKENEGFLPKEVADLFTAAEKVNYDSAVHKANAIKDGVIQEVFKLQANLDLLTAAHKKSVENYLKLTKNAREEKAQDLFENVLEPLLATHKRIKKAEEVNRSKLGLGNDQDQAYKQRLIDGSRKHYIGEKK